jgi:leader peptidase (prepilin peptidase)/N-methyltransferase
MQEIIAGQPLPMVFAVFLIGLVIGSFLNVVIHRLPIMLEADFKDECSIVLGIPPSTERPTYNLAFPRSACPRCGTQISARDNVPVLSWILLRGKCRHCSNPIAIRYPAIELLSGLLTAFAFIAFGASLNAFAVAIFSWFLIALFFIDADTYLLPDSLTLPLLWIGLAFNLANSFTSLQQAVIGAMAGYLALWSVYWLFKLVTGKEGMGYGDFKLLAALGAWLGWQSLPLLILLSSLAGAGIGIALILIAKREAAKPLPFGPYLAIAGLITIYYGPALNQLIWAGGTR